MESTNRLREDREAGVVQALEDHRNTQQKLPPQRKELSLREKELGLSREGTLGSQGATAAEDGPPAVQGGKLPCPHLPICTRPPEGTDSRVI